MDYSQFLYMIPEAVLLSAVIILFIADFCSSKTAERKWLNPLACCLTLISLPAMFWAAGQPEVELFGGMYQNHFGADVVKAILAAGTLIVIIMSRVWISDEKHREREGEFYMLLLLTLLGMFMMISAGHFLMFFIGLEMASVPLACLVAFDKYKKNSAEAAAKFIITATFSSGVMVYGISFLYGATGTLYFTDMASKLTLSPLTVMGLVFFFSGLGFKLSLVPFHFWTADTYQGAPTPVTGYLSVISKGAAAFTLLSILYHVFGSMMEQWHILLMVVIVLTITIANLFALRQKELKRFMAFSSISQAGYIMLSALGSDFHVSAAALMYYVLIYIAANMAVFTIITVVEQKNGGKTDIDDYNGFYVTNPKLSFLMTLALFSLGGIPPFAGMFSKFFSFMAGANGADVTTTMGGWTYAVIFIALLNTVPSLYYYLKIVKAMYIRHNDNPLPEFRSDVNTRLALALCTAGVALFGVCSAFYNFLAAAF
jgi:NADH-quinone oxidoreductase subunit N